MKKSLLDQKKYIKNVFRSVRGSDRAMNRLYFSREMSQLKDQAFLIKPKEEDEEKKRKNMLKFKKLTRFWDKEWMKRKATYFYVGGFVFAVYQGFQYMRLKFYDDQQVNHLKKKYETNKEELSEYEYLMLKANSQDRMLYRERKRYHLYRKMKDKVGILTTDVKQMFNPSEEELMKWVERQPEKFIKGHDCFEKKEYLIPGRDTTDFFENKALEYDNGVKWEELSLLMGFKRRWALSNLSKDVLEVSCGTGRNIPYLDLTKIRSITFLDSSFEMLKIAEEKFKKKYKGFKKVAFTHGKVENLTNLTEKENDKVFKYDYILDTFGLCSHENPVEALRSMGKLLKPGGRIVLLEHGRSDWKFINNHLDFKCEKRMKKWGCRWNLNIGELVGDAGLDIVYEKKAHLGTTWMLICKNNFDPLDKSEKPFFNKLFGIDIKEIKK